MIYPKDPRIVPYPLETLKYSPALISWTCADFFKLNDSLGQVVIQSKKVRTSLTRLGVRAFQVARGYGTIRGSLGYINVTER